jgi:hypothetical protein
MEAPLILYLGNRRASLILMIQIVSPCVSHESRMRLEFASRLRINNRDAAHSQKNAVMYNVSANMQICEILVFSYSTA